MPSEKILLVDDEKDFVSILSERLQSRGLHVDTAGDGFEAIEKSSTSSYDAIILDLKMPGIDGIETLEKLLAQNPDLQIILLTGYASLDKGIKAMKLGAMEFLEKPMDIEKLVAKIKTAKVNKTILVEKRMEEKIKEILEDKAW